MRKKILSAAITVGFIAAITAGTAFAAHPLITDDTGTQGRGKMQFEFIGEYGVDKEDGITEKGFEVPTIPFLSYGLSDTMDLVFGLPYSSVTIDDGQEETTVRGFTDASIELKVRFYEKDGLSLAVKPGVSLPTGDEEKGLGSGRPSSSAFFITTKEAGPWAFHFNVGYIRNEYKLQADEEANRKDIWHVSLASQVEVVKDLNLVANIGMERNSDVTSDVNPAFVLGGLVYALGNNMDLDFGVKGGLNRVETDYTVLAGVTWRL